MASALRVLLLVLVIVAPGGFLLLPFLAVYQLKQAKKPSALIERETSLLA